VAESEFGQGGEQKVPLYPIEGLSEVQQEEDQILVALHGPVQGVLSNKDIVEYAPALYKTSLIRLDNIWEEAKIL
jgi:hypothetical protein